jgi:AraC family transcriptional regulator of arabinose operon
MMVLSGSVLENSEIDFVDTEHPLTVTSCGHYSLLKRQRFSTNRPAGRKDYQLLYFINGKGKFIQGNSCYTVSEGEIFIYYPNEPQYYEYNLKDLPNLYWVHFTGNNIPDILDQLNLSTFRLHRVLVKDVYHTLLDKIIRELQLKRNHFDTLANTYFYELLTLMSRSVIENTQQQHTWQYEQVERAIQIFHTEFKNPFSLSDYAKQCNMSVSWFARIFRQQTGLSPQQYLINVRINKAKELLVSSSYNISEIAEIIGYQNPLYFSRIFNKYIGCSPSEYRKLHL